MRVAFCGAAGCGKTTLAKEISRIHDVPMNPVGSRSVALKMGHSNPYDVDLIKGQREIFQQRLLDDKMEWESATDKFVVDRTTFDVAAYTLMHCPSIVTHGFMSAASRGMDRYHVIFWCPITAFFDTAGDPCRYKEAFYHTAYDILLEGLLMRFYPDRIIKLTDSRLNGRLEIISKVLANI